jgi:acyl dehydratase
MAVDTSIIGKPTQSSRVVVERGPVANFAKAVTDENPIYQDAKAAKAAGLDAIPAPPTFSFAMEHWGKFAEQQPPTTVTAHPMMEAMGGLMAGGGLVLHGEQEFEYHRPLSVGDVLVSEGRIADLYEKETSSAVMTFIVTETVWKDDKTGEPVVTSRFNLIHRAGKK